MDMPVIFVSISCRHVCFDLLEQIEEILSKYRHAVSSVLMQKGGAKGHKLYISLAA